MKKSVNCVFAALLACTTSLAVAQTSPYAQTKPFAQTNPQVASCDASGCWGTDGTRYNRGAGNVVFGSNGKTCQLVAAGAPLMCN